MGFVHKEPNEISVRKSERDPELVGKLEEFRSKVQRRMCRFWSNADELGGIVSRSYVQLLKTHPAEGWIKYRYAKTTEELEKTNRMHEQIRILEQEVARLRESVGHAPANLARDADEVTLEYTYNGEGGKKEKGSMVATWNRIFSVVAHRCMYLPAEFEVQNALDDGI